MSLKKLFLQTLCIIFVFACEANMQDPKFPEFMEEIPEKIPELSASEKVAQELILKQKEEFPEILQNYKIIKRKWVTGFGGYFRPRSPEIASLASKLMLT